MKTFTLFTAWLFSVALLSIWLNEEEHNMIAILGALSVSLASSYLLYNHCTKEEK
jgi:hypothetical protein